MYAISRRAHPQTLDLLHMLARRDTLKLYGRFGMFSKGNTKRVDSVSKEVLKSKNKFHKKS